MKALYLVLGVALVALTGCGEDTDSRLSDSDVEYIKTQKYLAAYGSSTATSTVTESSTVTVTEVSSSTVTETVTSD